MDYVDDLRRVLGERLKEICHDEFEQAIEQMRQNIRNNTTNSHKQVNSLGLPASTTGETEESLHIEEDESNGLSVSIVGRDHIRNIDTGSSPEDIHSEYPSFEAFEDVIEEYAANKERRYFLDDGAIDATGMAVSLWNDGSKLYKEGGGTESLREPAENAANRIIERVTPELDRTIHDAIEIQLYDL